MTFSLFFQSLINGLNLGATYALIALGYTMVYGIIRMINFAHGDTVERCVSAPTRCFTPSR